jgi:two-component system LytT family response regulator
MQSLLTALVVDDEEKAVVLLKKLLSDSQQFFEIRTALSAQQAARELQLFSPNLVFLDINMPERSGMSLIKDLCQQNIKSEIIFVTAFDEYALEAIKNHAFGYLLKPVNRKELSDCVSYYREHRMANGPEKIAKMLEHFMGRRRLRISTRSGYYFVDPDDILFCEADGNYTLIELGDRNYLCTLQLGVVQTLLVAHSFVRTGRSLVVNCRKIRNVDKKSQLINFEKGSSVFPLKVSRSQLRDLENGIANESVLQ